MADVQDLIKKAVNDREVELVIELWQDGMPMSKIDKYAKLDEEVVSGIIARHQSGG